jgi:hypothetical protein
MALLTCTDAKSVATSPAQRRVEIARLLFVVDEIPKHERERVRQDLLDYCHRDALAMVRLVETLEGLPRVAP